MAKYELVQTDWSRLFPRAKQYAIEHSPQILTGIGLSAMIGGTIIAVKNTPAACRAIEDEKIAQNVDKLPIWDIIKVGFRYYVVPASMTIAGSVCIIGGLRVSTSRADAFAALAASEAIRLKDTKEVIREKIGEKKADEVETEVARREVERNGIPVIQQVEETGHGDQIVYWPFLERWFKCDIGWIRRVVNEINLEIEKGDVNENDPYDTKTLSGVALNRFLGGLGLRKCDVGMLLGWNGKNKLDPKFYDIVTHREAEKAVVLEMNTDNCSPTTKWDTVRQTGPVRIAPF